MAAVQTINRWPRAEARGNLNHRVFSPAFGAFITLHAWQWQSTLPFQPAVREECSSLKKGLPAEGCLDQEPPAVLLMSWGFMKTAMAMVRDGFPFPSFVSLERPTLVVSDELLALRLSGRAVRSRWQRQASCASL